MNNSHSLAPVPSVPLCRLLMNNSQDLTALLRETVQTILGHQHLDHSKPSRSRYEAFYVYTIDISQAVTIMGYTSGISQ